MCQCFACIFTCALCAGLLPAEARRGSQIPRIGITGVVRHYVGAGI